MTQPEDDVRFPRGLPATKKSKTAAKQHLSPKKTLVHAVVLDDDSDSGAGNEDEEEEEEQALLERIQKQKSFTQGTINREGGGGK
ncbi:MAG: hypothetical protein GY738_24550 [Pseudoalteromonas sp.]|nr:hypothetical protein [Pseudoalteromonas sp.]